MLSIVLMSVSCATVDSGHKGVEVSWGGETNMQTIYSEGMHGGLHWFFDSMEEYDVREKTLVQKFEFNDANNMSTGVELALDYNLDPSKVNLIHTQIADINTKIIKTLKSAGKEVVPQFTASNLNLKNRQQAEDMLTAILSRELPEFYVEFARIQVTDVDIPQAISKAAENTAKQIELNELALKKATEAENNFKAAEWDAQTKKIMSQPAMLALKQLEIQELWARKGVSPYGNNNVFGSDAVGVLKGLK